MKVSDSNKRHEAKISESEFHVAHQQSFGQQIMLSPGWTHYIINAPLSPKAHVALTKRLRQLTEQESEFTAFQSSALNIGLIDLGILAIERESTLKRVMDRSLKPYASLKVQATRFRVSHALPPHGDPVEGEPALLWLELRDRLGMLGSLTQMLSTRFKERGIYSSSPAPIEWAKNKKFSSEFALVLCGTISTYKLDIYEQVFSGSAWVNELVLQKRPSLFHPIRGYESVWRYTMPVETPLLSEQDEAELNPQVKTRRTTKLEPPLIGHDLERLQALEVLLEELKSDRSLTQKSTQNKRRRSSRRNPRVLKKNHQADT